MSDADDGRIATDQWEQRRKADTHAFPHKVPMLDGRRWGCGVVQRIEFGCRVQCGSRES